MVVLVTGAGGQLGQSLQFIAMRHPEIEFKFYNSAELDITNREQIQSVFNLIRPNFCINTAAYTAVDKAEIETDKAYLINVLGPKYLAEACKMFVATLIHVSTDFVFDGEQQTPYTETDLTNPKGVYGKTKRAGEAAIIEVLAAHFIVRTSWVYSPFGNNFMKTMLKLAKERSSLSVVNDQFGTPTNALDLAAILVKIVVSKSKNYGMYHFSNEGKCSWYDFAKKIYELNNIKIDLKLIPTTSFPTLAKRPSYSVLDKSKIKKEFNCTISSWEESLLKNRVNGNKL